MDAAPLITARGLVKSFGGEPILNGISLELHAGQTVLLTGENGSGKTTLLNILTGNLEPDSGILRFAADDSPRTYCFPRRWWQELNPLHHFTPEFVAHEGICRTWQDVRLFGSMSLGENLAVALQPPRYGPLDALRFWSTPATDRLAAPLLERLGLERRIDSTATRVSFGQTKRTAIARAWAAGARVLFLDEPLAGLDEEGIAATVQLLDELKDQRVTLVIVEHALNHSYLDPLVTTEWSLAKGSIEIKDVRRNGKPSPPKPPVWLACAPDSDGIVVTETIQRGANITRVVPPRDAPAPEMLRVDRLVLRRDARTIFSDTNPFSLVIHAGETVILHAPNGWGKTTLLLALAGFLPLESGEIYLNGHRITQLPPWDRVAAGLSVLLGHIPLASDLTVQEYASIAGISLTGHAATLARKTLSVLSGGEKQTVQLATMRAASVGVYDEPFAALDQERLVKLKLPENAARLVLLPAIGTFGANPNAPAVPLRTLKLWRALESRADEAPRSFSLGDWIPRAEPILEFSHVAPVLPSSLALLEYLRKSPPVGKFLLEFGCGSGVLAISAALLGAASIDAIDVNPQAVTATELNAKRHGLAHRINAFHSDGFGKIDRKYDIILANLPIVEVRNNESADEYGLLDANFRLHEAFCSELAHYLLPEGHALICHAELQPHWSFKEFELFSTQKNLRCEMAHESRRENIVWRIYRLAPLT